MTFFMGISSGSLAKMSLSESTHCTWMAIDICSVLTKFFIVKVAINAVYLVTRFIKWLAISGITSRFDRTMVNQFAGGVIIFQEIVAPPSILHIIRYLLNTGQSWYIWCRGAGGCGDTSQSGQRAISISRWLAHITRMYKAWLVVGVRRLSVSTGLKITHSQVTRAIWTFWNTWGVLAQSPRWLRLLKLLMS